LNFLNHPWKSLPLKLCNYYPLTDLLTSIVCTRYSRFKRRIAELIKGTCHLEEELWRMLKSWSGYICVLNFISWQSIFNYIFDCFWMSFMVMFHETNYNCPFYFNSKLAKIFMLSKYKSENMCYNVEVSRHDLHHSIQCTANDFIVNSDDRIPSQTLWFVCDLMCREIFWFEIWIER
jgi:hypothetical protein